jgi:hypothetical protein
VPAEDRHYSRQIRRRRHLIGAERFLQDPEFKQPVDFPLDAFEPELTGCLAAIRISSHQGMINECLA